MYWLDVRTDEWQDRRYIGREIDSLRAMAELLADAGEPVLADQYRERALCLELEYDAPFTLDVIW